MGQSYEDFDEMLLAMEKKKLNGSKIKGTQGGSMELTLVFMDTNRINI